MPNKPLLVICATVDFKRDGQETMSEDAKTATVAAEQGNESL